MRQAISVGVVQKVCKVMPISGLSEEMNATDRIRRRVQQLGEDKRFRQKRIAERMGIEPTSVSRYVNGPTPLTIPFLEAIAEETKIPLAELIAPEETWKQLNADELALLRALRQWPLSVTRALCAFLAFFADEPAQVKQTRNLHELWRRLPPKRREWLYGVAVLLAEGTLAPDLQARLMGQLEAEQQAYRDDPEGRRRTDGDA